MTPTPSPRRKSGRRPSTPDRLVWFSIELHGDDRSNLPGRPYDWPELRRAYRTHESAVTTIGRLMVRMVGEHLRVVAHDTAIIYQEEKSGGWVDDVHPMVERRIAAVFVEVDATPGSVSSWTGTQIVSDHTLRTRLDARHVVRDVETITRVDDGKVEQTKRLGRVSGMSPWEPANYADRVMGRITLGCTKLRLRVVRHDLEVVP